MAGQIPVQQLAPMPQQIGVFDSFIARQTETFILKEKVMSLSGDSFDIKMANGQPILKVVGNVLSLSGRKAVTDMAGNQLFEIKKEHLHLHSTYVANDPKGQKFLEVKSKFKREYDPKRRRRLLVLSARAQSWVPTRRPPSPPRAPARPRACR